jgi:uncharacterized membrane protein
VELQCVLQEADPEYAEIDRSALRIFPVREEDLFQYDVIVLGDVNPARLGASGIEHLARFVTVRGGGLIVSAGPRFMPAAYLGTPLEEVLPVDLTVAPAEPRSEATEPFVLAPTELGLETPGFRLADSIAESREQWRQLAPLYWFYEPAALKPGARVLAEHPTAPGPQGGRIPLVMLQYAGAGKVVFHAFDDTRRWRFRVGDRWFARYWVQTLRYLSRAKLLGKDRAAELVVDRREYRRGESVRLRLRFLDDRLAPAEDDGAAVIVEQAGQPNRRITLHRTASDRGMFEGSLARAATGDYHAWLAAPTLEGSPPAVDFRVAPPPGETARIEADLAALRALAEATKGRYYAPNETAGLLKDLPDGRQVPVETLPPAALWNRWPGLVLMLAALVAEWIGRKRCGLL